jgi:hypothetical protein
VVLDFNSYNVTLMQNNLVDSFPNAIIQKITHRDIFVDGRVFAEPVWTSLPYISCESRRKFSYDVVLMDEERILGLRHVRFPFSLPCQMTYPSPLRGQLDDESNNANVTSVDVLYFG